MEENKKETKTVYDIIEEVAEGICDKICKYSDKTLNADMTDGELNKICAECPLNRLYV